MVALAVSCSTDKDNWNVFFFLSFDILGDFSVYERYGIESSLSPELDQCKIAAL